MKKLLSSFWILLFLFCSNHESTGQFHYSQRTPKPFLKGTYLRIYTPKDSLIFVQTESAPFGPNIVDPIFLKSENDGRSWGKW